MMLIDLLGHTHVMMDFLSLYELGQLRQTCLVFKEWVDKTIYPSSSYTWVQKCRLCDPHHLWMVDGQEASCYHPIQKKWVMIYWKKKLPSVIPSPFWNYFMRIMKGFVSLSHFQQWCAFEPHPAVIPPRVKRWDIGMVVSIVGTAVHNDENYPTELKDIDEFVSVGVTLRQSEYLQDNILGLNPYSIGWHSDDGKIYMDSLVVNEGQFFGRGDYTEIVLDYTCGILLFKKNHHLVYLHELTGEFLSNPLIFSATCSTMNNLFFSIM